MEVSMFLRKAFKAMVMTVQYVVLIFVLPFQGMYFISRPLLERSELARILFRNTLLMSAILLVVGAILAFPLMISHPRETIVFSVVFSLTMVYGSFFEYTFHKYLLHGFILQGKFLRKFLRPIVKPFLGHTTGHHVRYGGDETYTTGDREPSEISFSWKFLPALLVLHLPFMVGLYFWPGMLASIALLCALILYYVDYETIHYMFHTMEVEESTA